jgi:hypothetical protein
MHRKENSTPYVVCISQLQLSSITLVCSHQAGSEGGYKIGLQAEYQAGLKLDSDNISNNRSFHLKHVGVPDGSDGSGRTSHRLMENQM